MQDLNADTKQEIDEILNMCEAHREKIINHCIKAYNCNRITAEESVQKAYIALYKNLANGTKIESPLSWLYKVARNCTDREIKNEQKRNECEFSDSVKAEFERNNYELNKVYSIEDELILDEQIHDSAIRIISQLTEEERQLYMLYYRKRKKLTEISFILKVSPLTIRKRHSRLKSKLQAMINESED